MTTDRPRTAKRKLRNCFAVTLRSDIGLQSLESISLSGKISTSAGYCRIFSLVIDIALGPRKSEAWSLIA
jgi:hypothetical protein